MPRISGFVSRCGHDNYLACAVRPYADGFAIRVRDCIVMGFNPAFWKGKKG